MRKIHLLLVVGVAAAVSACSGNGATPSSASLSASASPSASSSRNASPSTSTEKQVASVIAGQEAGLRKAIDGGGKCRILMVTARDDSPLDQANVLSCYTDEVTAGLSAQIAVRDLGKLTPPESMKPLVDETVTELEAIGLVDLETACGPAMTKPNLSEDCNRSLGIRMMQYTRLKTILDKWRPYL